MIRIFIAYSSKDLVFKDEIRKRLRPLQRAGKVEIWDNYDIEGGKDWDAEIKEKLVNSDLILLLLSPDALDSEYFYEVEAPIALARHQAGDAIAVGVLLRPCSFRHTPFEFGKYELLPKKGYPITDSRWHNADEAYLSVFEAVDDLVEQLAARQGSTAFTPSVSASFTAEEVVVRGVNAPSPDGVNAVLPAAMYKNGQVIRDIPEGPELVFVEGGRFVMGSDDDENSKPIHPVQVPSFWLGKYPVTTFEYDAFCVEVGKKKPLSLLAQWRIGNVPVFRISWQDAQWYCKWLTEKTGYRYRLPTEAEWEYAAGGGEMHLAISEGTGEPGLLFSGSNILSEVGWYDKNSNGAIKEVGQKRPNKLGLFDMSGNVWEWCQDAWHPNYKNAPNDGTSWGTGDAAVLRGGSYDTAEINCRNTSRDREGVAVGGDIIGFRVVRDV